MASWRVRFATGRRSNSAFANLSERGRAWITTTFSTNPRLLLHVEEVVNLPIVGAGGAAAADTASAGPPFKHIFRDNHNGRPFCAVRFKLHMGVGARGHSYAFLEQEKNSGNPIFWRAWARRIAL
ncbi:cytochrome P450 [Aspergillus luchuensis]|uniref:Cytochrome P450 n=1 Tax=Aspergillus kawachii TaxID=1069201 RepID=A0A146F0P4_ASPKA|nr:cytochrome P450 [Aspergillus luchuensis]